MVPFGPRGTRLWKAYCERADGEAGLALLEEVCRTADRLDRLDALLVGDLDSWLSLDIPPGRKDGPIELHIDSALSEARQQAGSLRQLLANLPLKEPDDADADSWLDMPAAVRDAEGPAVPDLRD
jgi:hypothetical protein